MVTFIISPYKEQIAIHKKVLKVIRKYRDPRELKPCTTLMDGYIKVKIEKIDEIFDDIDKQKDIHSFYFISIFVFEISIGTDCCNLNISKRIQVLRNLRSYIFSSTYLNNDSIEGLKEIDKFDKFLILLSRRNTFYYIIY